LEHWHYVRSSEMRNIIPYVNTSDYIVNGALPYELPVMRRLLLDSFAGWAKVYKSDPLRIDAYSRATRIHQLLEAVAPISEEEETAIPPTSLLREFIGGSAYEY
jgi:uridine kinase